MNLVLYCQNCGSPRAERDLFCVRCGFRQQVPPGAAAAAPPAPVAPAPADQAPAVPPVTLQPSPTLAPGPAGAAPPTPAAASAAPAGPRLPMPQLIAAVVGASVGVAALAMAITFALSRGGPAPDDPDPPPSGDLQVVDVANIRAEVPTAWAVVTRARDTIVVEDPAGRLLWLRSANLPAAITLDAIQGRFLDKARTQSPDARICAGPETAALPGGPAGGRYFVICSTYVPQGGGPAVRLADAHYIGLDTSALIASVMQISAIPNAIEAFATEVRRLPPPVWKLYGG